MRTNDDKRTILVEVLTASGCTRCQQAKLLAKAVIAELADPRIQYRELNVVEEIDYAVALGIMSTPAIALDGKLVFPAVPSRAALRQAIKQRLGGA